MGLWQEPVQAVRSANWCRTQCYAFAGLCASGKQPPTVQSWSLPTFKLHTHQYVSSLCIALPIWRLVLPHKIVTLEHLQHSVWRKESKQMQHYNCNLIGLFKRHFFQHYHFFVSQDVQSGHYLNSFQHCTFNCLGFFYSIFTVCSDCCCVGRCVENSREGNTTFKNS